MRGVHVKKAKLEEVKKYLTTYTNARLKSLLNHQGEWFYYKITINNQFFFFSWFIPVNVFRKKIGFSNMLTLKKTLFLMTQYFAKSQKRFDLLYGKAHQNLVVIYVSEGDKHEMAYRTIQYPIRCEVSYILTVMNAIIEKNNPKLIQELDAFATTLIHELEHVITDIQSTLDITKEKIFAEGMSEVISYFSSSLHLFTQSSFNSRLHYIYLNVTQKRPLKNKMEYQVGFYLFMLLFIKIVNQKYEEKSPFINFKSSSFENKIQQIKHAKKIMMKSVGKEELRETVITFREVIYKLNKKKLNQFLKQIEKELHTGSDVAKEYL